MFRDTRAVKEDENGPIQAPSPGRGEKNRTDEDQVHATADYGFELVMIAFAGGASLRGF